MELLNRELYEIIITLIYVLLITSITIILTLTIQFITEKFDLINIIKSIINKKEELK